MLIGENLLVSYPTMPEPALSGVSVRLVPGQRNALLGASGAGKSTLLRVLAGLQKPSAGEVRRGDWRPVSRSDWRQWHRRVAMVFQDHGLIPRKSVLWHVLLGRLGRQPLWRSAWLTPRDEITAALEALDQVGLADLAHRRVRDCSGGQRQRVGIARALLQGADVLLADEPIASLDPQTGADVLANVSRFANPADGAPRSLLVSLHQIDVAREWADRVIVLDRGRIAFDGPPDDLDHHVLPSSPPSPPQRETA